MTSSSDLIVSWYISFILSRLSNSFSSYFACILYEKISPAKALALVSSAAMCSLVVSCYSLSTLLTLSTSWRIAAYIFSLINDLVLILAMTYGSEGRSIFCGIIISLRAAGVVLTIFVF